MRGTVNEDIIVPRLRQKDFLGGPLDTGVIADLLSLWLACSPGILCLVDLSELPGMSPNHLESLLPPAIDGQTPSPFVLTSWKLRQEWLLPRCVQLVF